MMRMRKSQCKFCTSRKCNHRIVTPDLTYDEIACVRHFKELAEHSDNELKGAVRAILETTGQVKRGEPYPFDAAAGVRERALRDAAGAVCGWCRDGLPIVKIEPDHAQSLIVHRFNSPPARVEQRCLAAGIHRMIEWEKEGGRDE